MGKQGQSSRSSWGAHRCLLYGFLQSVGKNTPRGGRNITLAQSIKCAHYVLSVCRQFIPRQDPGLCWGGKGRVRGQGVDWTWSETSVQISIEVSNYKQGI